MVNAGSDDRQSEGDIYRVTKSLIFHNRKSLIMVHRDMTVGLCADIWSEGCIRRERSFEMNVRELLPQRFKSRTNDFNLFAAEMPIFSCMRIQA